MSLPETDPAETVIMSGADLAQLVAQRDELLTLLLEAEPIIASMADWFRNQPLGAPPVGTADLQSRLRAAIAAASGAAA
jgi:hypothetical protein